VDLLKELKLKFEDDRVTATKEETNKLNGYELAKEARKAAIAAAKDAKNEKEETLGTVEKDLAAAESDLKNTRGFGGRRDEFGRHGEINTLGTAACSCTAEQEFIICSVLQTDCGWLLCLLPVLVGPL